MAGRCYFFLLKKLFNRAIHVLRKRYGECTLPAFDGDGELDGSQLEPLDACLSKRLVRLEVAVLVVSGNRSARLRKLDAYLVHASGAERDVQEGEFYGLGSSLCAGGCVLCAGGCVLCAGGCVLCAGGCVLCAGGIDSNHFLDDKMCFRGLLSSVRLDDALYRARLRFFSIQYRFTDAYCRIFLLHEGAGDELHPLRSSFARLCNNQDSCGLLVETVHKVYSIPDLG